MNDFDNLVEKAGDKLVVVDFFATWCGPCNNVAPHVEQFAKTYEDQTVVIKVDVDHAGELAGQRFAITSMPTFIFIKNGKVVKRFSGGDPNILEDNIKKFIN